jgi:diacylglycerol kinase
MSGFEWRTRVASVRHALRGAVWLVRTQANARLHLLATGAVVTAGWLLEVPGSDWLWLVWSLVGVWMAEAFNTALEFLADEVSEERRERIGKAKDVAAFAVLVTAAGAAITGAVVLGRRLLG